VSSTIADPRWRRRPRRGCLAGVNSVIAVLGGSGGVGASTFAAALAWVAGAALIDLDDVGGGLDVRLGIEREPGARWSDLRLSGGRLDPRALVDGLPRWHGTPVLAVDCAAPHGVAPVLAAAAAAGPVVLDLPRAPSPARAEALAASRLVVLIARASVAPLAAARAVLAGLPEIPAGVLLRPGEVPEPDAAALLGRPVLGRLPTLARPVDLAERPPPRALLAVALGVLDGLPGPGPDGGCGPSGADRDEGWCTSE
jgi:hypothetical protein